MSHLSNPFACRLSALSLALLVLLSACGGGGGDAPPPEAAPTATSTTDPAATATTPTPATCTAAVNGSTGYSLVFRGCSVAGVAEYYDKTECVRDNATGLIWQGQMPAGSGSIRANDRVFSNLDSTADTQNYNNNSPIPATQAQIDAGSNAVNFKNAINASSLCGNNAWRIPTRAELFGIVNASQSAPAIDSTWFPNTASAVYWTSTPYTPVAPATSRPWLANAVDFYFAGNNSSQYSDYRSGGNASSALIRVRLVHN